MRLVVQNVLNASVTVDDKLISSINKGYLVLVGFSLKDDFTILDKMADKLLNMRVFDDENGKTNLSIRDVNGEILVASQFTLYADFKSGRRPSFISALKGEESVKLYNQFINLLRSKLNKDIKTGIFGANMKVSLINDGPFTSILDSDILL